MEHVLGLLEATPEIRMSDARRTGTRFSEALAARVRTFDRKISLEALTDVMDEALRRFHQDDDEAGSRIASDAWLAPRLHAALRVDRREATIDEIWTFLALYAYPDYVLWRWGDRDLRFLSSDLKKHAFRRLWWGAELFRNGASYHAVGPAFKLSDIPNTLIALRAVHNRAIALGLLKFVEMHKLTSRQVNALSTQLNSSAVTVALDRVAAGEDEASGLDERWLYAEPLAAEILAGPSGPAHGYVSDSGITRMVEALQAVIDLTKVREYRREPSREAEPGEAG